jgi:hypothetical protein
VIDLRKLAAIDVAFLGPKFVLAEYAVGVIFSITLGIFVLLRSQSYWQVVLGIYFLGLGANYIPMLCWAISIKDRQSARSELGSELTDKGRAMAKYRKQSLVLLIPLFSLVLTFTRQRAKSRDR